MSRLIRVRPHADRLIPLSLLLLFVLCAAAGGAVAPPAAAAPGDVLWEKEYIPGDGSLSEVHVAVAPSGRIFVGGLFRGPGGVERFDVTCYRPDGTVVWAKTEPLYATNAGLAGMAVDGKGGVVLTGHADSYGDPVVWVTCRWKADGTHAYTQTLGLDEAKACGVVCDGAGNAYVAGTVGLGRGTAPYEDWRIVKYDATGATVWSKTFNGTASRRDEPKAIARAADGSVYVAGLSIATSTKGRITVLRFTSAGRRVWTRTWSNVPGTMGAAAYAVAAKKSGVVAAGAAADADGHLHPALVRYSAAGKLAWAKVYGYTGDGQGIFNGVALDGDGNVVAVTRWQATPSADDDVLAIRYRATGRLAWTRGRVSAGTDDAPGLAVDRYGNVFVAGSIAPAGPRTCFTWSLNPRGGSRWYETRTHWAYASGHDVAVTRTAAYVAGDQGDGGWFLVKYVR